MDANDRTKTSLADDSRYRLLVEAITDCAIVMLDAAGRVSSWNAGAERLEGYRAAEIIGEPFSRLHTEEDRLAGLPEAALAEAAQAGKFEAEGWRQRKDGSRFWAHVVIDPVRDGGPALIGYATITRDLTERRQAEAALRRSQEQFRLLVQGVTDYAIYMLDTEGRVVSWNAGAERIKGYRQDEILGRHFSQFYRDEDRRLGHPATALETARREGRFESEGFRVRKDGTQFWASVVVDAIHDDAGRHVGFAKITRDVTAKREAQQSLQASRETLFQSQKMEAIGQLTGGIAHDFNNLLMVIISSLTLVQRLRGDDPRQEKFLANALKAATRGASLTQRMLSFARQQELKPAPTDVVALARDISELLQRSVGPSVSLQIADTPGLRRVHVDANQLELAIVNLVVNARDAMPQGGVVSIVAANEAAPPAHSKMAPGPCVRLSVVDNGSGMDAQTLARATDPFFTTKGVGKGTGLGLSMVLGLAEQSGGHLALSSVPGQGTTASLWLPISDAPAVDAPAVETHAPEPASTRTLCVLVVDDDPLVLTNAAAILETMGHAVVTAASAGEAFVLLRERPGIEVLLTDQAMPDMNGIELIERARHEHPGIGMILATGYNDLKSSLPNSVVRLGKPFGVEALAAALADSLARA